MTIKILNSLFFVFLFMLVGCATPGFLGGTNKDQMLEDMSKTPRYSETPQVGVQTGRQYKRYTRNSLEEESELNASAGSMWVMEGQGAYLFAQNKSRREGDVLAVKLDGTAQKQIETKVGVIKKLLKQLEEQENAANASRGLASEAPAAKADANGKPVAAAPAKAEPKVDSKADEKETKELLESVANVPSKIVERLADGNYRIKGAQPFMIGKREYKVIVTGMIRPEDFNDEGISSQKLLDPQYDVVSIRRSSRNE